MAKLVKDELVCDVSDKLVTVPAKVARDQTIKGAVDALLRVPITRKVYVVDAKGKLEGVVKIETLLRHVGYRMGVREPGVSSYIRMLSEALYDKVEDIMEVPVTIMKTDTLAHATELMIEHHLNDLPVVDEHGILTGELNSMEILTAAVRLFDEKRKT